MKTKIKILVCIIIAGWLLFFNYMLFPPKTKDMAELQQVIQQKEKKKMPAPVQKASSKKKVKKKKKPKRRQTALAKKKDMSRETSSGYPWRKLQDEDVFFALALSSLISFAAGVSYFQLGWKKKLRRELK